MHFAPSRATFLIIVLSAALLSSCRTPANDDSDVKTVREAQTTGTDTAPLLTFITTAKTILGSAAKKGTIPANQFIGLMPLSAPDRQVLNAAYPGAFEVTCSGKICSAEAHGAASVATLLASVKVSFFLTISNPQLSVAEQILADFTLRSDQAVEFCNVSGLTVSKLGVVQTIYGLFDRIEGGSAKLAVADEPGDLTCQ